MGKETKKDTGFYIFLAFLIGLFIWVIVGIPMWITDLKSELKSRDQKILDYTAEDFKTFESIINNNKLKLDYLWSKLSEKDRCRFESENGLFPSILVEGVGGLMYEYRTPQNCAKWLKKTESKYLIE